jgi:hypothetical protein
MEAGAVEVVEPGRGRVPATWRRADNMPSAAERILPDVSALGV